MTIGRAFIVNPSWWFDWLVTQKAKECIKNNVFVQIGIQMSRGKRGYENGNGWNGPLRLCVCCKSGWKVKVKAISVFNSKATGGNSGRNSFRKTKLHLKLKFWVARGALTFHRSSIFQPLILMLIGLDTNDAKKAKRSGTKVCCLLVILEAADFSVTMELLT